MCSIFRSSPGRGGTVALQHALTVKAVPVRVPKSLVIGSVTLVMRGVRPLNTNVRYGRP